MSLTFSNWIEIANGDYPIVVENYNNVIYEADVINRQDGSTEHVTLTLCEVCSMCEGTFLETRLKRAIMKCVYAYHSLESEVKKIMDVYYCL